MKFFRSIRDWLTDDFGWKVFSLLLAIAIWLTVHRILGGATAPSTQSGIIASYGNLPVVLVSPNVDVRNYRLLQTTISVTVSGPPDVIGKLQADQLHATVNLTDTNNLNSTKQHVDVSVPPGVTLMRVTPDAIGVLPPPPGP
jgi:YbbR domain-containing protein